MGIFPIICPVFSETQLWCGMATGAHPDGHLCVGLHCSRSVNRDRGNTYSEHSSDVAVGLCFACHSYDLVAASPLLYSPILLVACRRLSVQVRWVAAPAKSKGVDVLEELGKWVTYGDLVMATLRMNRFGNFRPTAFYDSFYRPTEHAIIFIEFICREVERLNARVFMPPRDAAAIYGQARLFYKGVDMLEEEARLYHDNALASMLAGYLPPWRPKCIR